MESVAEHLQSVKQELVAFAQEETGLPEARLNGELDRTANQWRIFAKFVQEGSCFGATIDPALPDRTPLPRPDLRMIKIPLGPVAVFGASNFPFAFSVAGGDTASAVAAGCPVVIKANPAHPQLSQKVFNLLVEASRDVGLPESLFGLVQGGAREGLALVQDPAIQGVGFTGSQRAGLALWRACQNLPIPIPCFAEMGSLNPILVFPSALTTRKEALAEGYVSSLTLGVGQFCTNPGLLLLPEGEDAEAFLNLVAKRLGETAPAPMLSPAISHGCEDGWKALSQREGARVLVAPSGDGCSLSPGLAAFQSQAVVDSFEEVFGPIGIVVTLPKDSFTQEASRILRLHQGQLTGTIHGEEGEETELGLSLLMPFVGRIVWNGWPTGVEVTHAMQHGGPFPATTDARFTSVGPHAIDRWLRPISLQNLPASHWPPELGNGNELGIRRRVGGQME
jgi:NADP-dependent aldehyde dehydrogenase